MGICANSNDFNDNNTENTLGRKHRLANDGSRNLRGSSGFKYSVSHLIMSRNRIDSRDLSVGIVNNKRLSWSVHSFSTSALVE